MKKHDAVLEIFEGTPLYGRISGRIYSDSLTTGNHPFPDGTPVSTSPVVSKENGVITTRSGTRYLIRWTR